MNRIKYRKVICNIINIVFKSAPIAVIVLFLYAIIYAVTPAILTYVIAGMLDSAYSIITSKTGYNKLIIYAVVYVSIYIINDFMLLASSVLENTGLYEKSLNSIKYSLYLKMTKIPLLAFEDPDFLDKKLRAEQSIQDEIIPATFQEFTILARSILAIISIIVILVKYSIWLIPLAVISVIPYFIARIVRGKQFFKLKQFQARKSRYMSYLWKLFCDRKTVKEMRVMGFDKYIANKWMDIRDDVNEETWSLTIKDSKTLFFCDAFRILCYSLSIIVVLKLTLAGALTIGIFGACLNTFITLQENAKVFLISLGKSMENLAHASVYFEFLDCVEEQDEFITKASLEKGIKVQNLSFQYPNAQENALNSISFDIEKNETVVILGENGSGKTTLSKLILGMYPASNGSICFDDKNISQVSKSSFYELASAMTQNFVNYSLSIRENIAISAIDGLHDDNRIDRVLKEVEMNEVVAQKGGYDAKVGREFDGVEFSGGQWQKIAIARSLFKDHSLIVLDEPTSALDPMKESEILQRFLDISKDKTAIIISHRVGLCRFASKIIVMDHGQISEIGSHEELLRKNGTYTKLYEEQKRWYD